MHVPDGYLSPSTCAVMYGAALPFWSVAVRRLRRALTTRFIPTVALMAAFSFVVMMFNIPLPGGTTGHATAVALAAIVLGPWGATLAISIALAIQALFFGDGGVTTLGANCFNIAIAGSLTASFAYRFVSGRSETGARRRVVAAAIAGFTSINVAALLTAIELGLQPLLFSDAAGTPLYAPYPLKVAVPAMMLGHLTVAGLAEMILTAGVVSWLQQSEPALMSLALPQPAVVRAQGGRRLWLALAAIMTLTPLGLIAAGSAWGEWSVDELASATARTEIAAASSGAGLPAAVPAGLAKLSTMWTAPISDYAPPFMRSAIFGYLLSAVFGVGLILATVLAIGLLTRRRSSRVALM